MFEDCKKEVIELHEFFKQWFKAEIENNEEVYSRLEKALDKDFLLISPDGSISPRDKLLVQLKAGYSSHKDATITYELWVQNIQLRLLEGNLCLVTYEEWGKVHGKVNARLSSALFRRKVEAPNGVEWVHVHEVSIPTKE